MIGHKRRSRGTLSRGLLYNTSGRSSLIQILELQQKKRDLADAILNADNRVISTLTREDLEFLLS